MKIESVETFSRRSLTIVRVRTTTGEEGYGQVAPFHADITARVFHRQVAPHVLGEDPRDIAGLVQKCIVSEYKFPGSYICRAVAGLDTALWDLKGKLSGKPVCELLGGEPRMIPVYGSSMRRDIKPVAEAERLQRLKEEDGYEAFKIRIGSVCGENKDQWPGRTESLVPTVREALGPDTDLYVDANSCYTPEKAIEVGEMLSRYGVCHFEEPCPYWELDWTAQVTRRLDIPVAGGEQDNSLPQWRRIVDNHVVDIVQPDICYIGGLSRALQVAEMAEEKGRPCTPHSANLSLVSVFTLHLLAAIPNAGPYMEFSIENSEWVGDLYTPRLQVQDGRVPVPSGPGWGVEISKEWMARSTYQQSK